MCRYRSERRGENRKINGLEEEMVIQKRLCHRRVGTAFGKEVKA